MAKRKICNQFHLGWCCLALMLCVFSGANGIFGQNKTGVRRSTQAAPEKTLVGRWQSDEATVEIRSNGTIVINGETYSYEINGSTITISDNEGSMDIPFQLNGDQLVVRFEGRRIVYRRIAAAKSKETSADSKTKVRAGGVLPDLVGKWCYLSSVNLNSSNSRMTNRCFTLNEDGTYEYYSETSTSGSVASSASTETDVGRWSATETTITARSNKYGEITYSLEKRNHPKNGDPMLIVDGDAFVTAYKKEPW
ncbi:MAG: hypothetical protein M3209_02965 [Acidobacteriota bacterium]|nr:hypothetical protein [Acidobacteriota bacterium]